MNFRNEKTISSVKRLSNKYFMNVQNIPEGKMKSIKITMIVIVSAVLTLTACNIETPVQTGTNEIPNPASVFCKENGGTLEMRQAADGSVAGFCLFSDGSECDEWAYFRGECKVGDSLKTTEVVETPGSTLQPGTEAVSDWWGTIKSTPAGAQYNDFFERQDLGQVISYGIDSIDPVIQSQIEALRDSGKIVHLYGIISLDAPDYNGSQIQPDRIVVE
jgi:putative hemolysin